MPTNGVQPVGPEGTRAPDDELQLLYDRCNVGAGHADRGNYELAANEYRTALQGAQRCGNARLSAEAGLGLGLALVELRQCDDAVAVLEVARKSFADLVPYPIPRRVADCDQAMGRAFHGGGLLDDAIASYESALEVYTDREMNDERVSCSLNLANVLAVRGRFGDALTTLKDVEHECVQHSDAIKVAINKGVICADSGQYEPAHEQLEMARATASAAGHDGLVAMCDTNLGYLHRHTGRWDHAEAAFTRARDFYEHRDLEKFAMSWLNLGTVRGARGEHEVAIDAYEKSLDIFESLQLSERIAVCRMNLGVEHAALKNNPEARKFYSRAQAFFESSPVYARQAAGCLVNVAALHEHPDKRQAALVDAAQRFRDLELFEWEARCMILAAAMLPDDEAIELLLPALLYIDSVKFQFPTAAARLAWRGMVIDATRQAFELAMSAGDAELVAELIETTVNSGIHTTTADVRGDKHVDNNLVQLTRAGWTSVDRSNLGPVRLIAGAGLPMASPPRLRMPTGAIALERFHKAADRYQVNSKDSRSSPVVVDTWPVSLA